MPDDTHPILQDDELSDFRVKIKSMSDKELAALEAVLRRGEATYREELLALQYVIHCRLQQAKLNARGRN